MASWELTLVVEGVDLQDEEAIEALFEAGLDDAMVSRSGGVQLVDVDRDADSYAGALLRALHQLRVAAPSGRVVRVEPDQLVTMAEVAERYARSRESVRLLMAGEPGPGGFPLRCHMAVSARVCGAGRTSWPGFATASAKNPTSNSPGPWA